MQWSWRHPCLLQWGWTRWHLKVPFNPHHSFCDPINILHVDRDDVSSYNYYKAIGGPKNYFPMVFCCWKPPVYAVGTAPTSTKIWVAVYLVDESSFRCSFLFVPMLGLKWTELLSPPSGSTCSYFSLCRSHKKSKTSVAVLAASRSLQQWSVFVHWLLPSKKGWPTF